MFMSHLRKKVQHHMSRSGALLSDRHQTVRYVQISWGAVILLYMLQKSIYNRSLVFIVINHTHSFMTVIPVALISLLP